jgi:hypothetical protein
VRAWVDMLWRVAGLVVIDRSRLLLNFAVASCTMAVGRQLVLMV